MENLNELALFAGAGGGILGGKLLGWRTVCAVEIDAYAAGILARRQNEGILAPFPIWDDVRTFNGKPWNGIVDVVSGGFPCQDISVAGKGAGIDGARSGLWREFARIIRGVGPRYVLVENSPALVARGLGTVLGDLAALGYDARWGVLGAHHAGAPHRRDRIWILADSEKQHRPELRCEAPESGRSGAYGADTISQRLEGQFQSGPAPGATDGPGYGRDTTWWETEPDVGRVAYGVDSRVDRLRCLGNGQVPAVVKLAWETLTERL